MYNYSACKSTHLLIVKAFDDFNVVKCTNDADGIKFPLDYSPSPMFLIVQFSSILLWYSAIIFGWWFSITTSGGEDSTWEQTVQTNISKLKTC